MASGQLMDPGHPVRPPVAADKKREGGSAAMKTSTARELLVQGQPRVFRVAQANTHNVSFPL